MYVSGGGTLLKSKGFTLIELLAVIVILAIIAAIAIPIVINIIKETKVSSIKRSSELYIDAVELTLANAKMDNIDITQCKIEKENLVCGDKKYKIEINGNHPEEVEIQATKNGEVYFAMQYEGYCALKTESEKTTKYKKMLDEVTNYEKEADEDSCSLTPIYTTSRKCFAFDSSTGTITSYYDYENNDNTQTACPKDVVIPRKINKIEVTNIGFTAFLSKNLTSIIIPNTIISIGVQAFNGNKLPQDQAYIYKRNSDGSIDYTTIIGYGGEDKNIIIPSEKNGVKLTTIGENAFVWSNLRSVEIPDTVTTIENSAFGYNKLTNINLPNNLITIGNSAFTNNSITEINVPYGVENVGAYAFSNNSIISYSLPTTIKTKGEYLFKNNKLPQENAYFYYEDGNGNIDYSKVIYYGGELKDIEIPSEKNGVKLTTIETGAFGYLSLTNVVIPDGVEIIKKNSFYSNKLTSIVIPSSVKIIEAGAFARNSLTSVTIKNSKENMTLGSQAFGTFDTNNIIWEPVEE